MLQRLSDLWCTHNGAEGFDCFIIGKVSIPCDFFILPSAIYFGYGVAWPAYAVALVDRFGE